MGVPATTVSSWAPASMFASWSEDGVNISVPIASLELLTAALADGETGDARQVAASLCETMYRWYNGLTTKPQAMEVQLLSRQIQTFGDFAGKDKITYSFTFAREYAERTVVAEPSS